MRKKEIPLYIEALAPFVTFNPLGTGVLPMFHDAIGPCSSFVYRQAQHIFLLGASVGETTKGASTPSTGLSAAATVLSGLAPTAEIVPGFTTS